MRLANIVAELGGVALPAAQVSNDFWVPLRSLAREFGIEPGDDAAPKLEDFLPGMMDRFAEFSDAIFRTDVATVSVTACEILPPILRPPAFRDFYAFEAHVKTARAKRGLEMVPAWYEIPVFYFSNANSIVGTEAQIWAPLGCAELDYELELGIVIGKSGRDIPRKDAWDYVAGLTIVNDLSARDLQRKEMSVGLGPSKGKDFATAIGPVLVTRDEFSDSIAGETLRLEMVARVNGREFSRGNSDSLFHPISTLIAHASRDADLFPGDILGTGTVGTGCILELGPENCGGWLKPGDVVELEIERIGTLRTHIIQRPA